MKKILSLFVTLIMLVLVFGGCTQKKTAVKDEDPSKVPEDSYEISWYLPITAQKDTQYVEAKINEYLKDKINATVKFYFLESSQYKEKMNAMISSGEYFDLAFCATWMLNYRMNAANDAFIPLDDYFDKYMPKIYEASDKEALENARVNGKIYALPVIKENSQQIGWIYRKDIADKYGINMDQIKSFEALEQYLQKIKEKEPDIQYPVDWSDDSAPVVLMDTRCMADSDDGFYLFNDGTYPENEIKSIFDTPEYLKACETAHHFYQSGLVRKDVITATDLNQRMKDGKTFCHLCYLKPGKVDEIYKDAKFPFAQSGITPVRKDPAAGTLSMTAVSATSKNPVRVMRFLELVNSDSYLNNLIVYGLENRNYDKVSDNVVKLIPNSGYSLSGNQWMIGNIFLNYTTTTEDPQKLVKLKNFDQNSTWMAAKGFTFNSEPVQQYMAACATVSKQYKKQIEVGAVDPQENIPQFKDKLKEAGIDKIREELQKQFNDYLSKK